MLIRSKENTFTARFFEREESVFLKGTSLLEILEYLRPPHFESFVLAKVNNHVCNLRECIEEDCLIEWIPMQSVDGHRSYIRTLCFVFLRALKEIHPKQKVRFRHSTSNGFHWVLGEGKPVSRRLVKKIRARMDEIIQKNEPIQPEILLRNQAIVFFQEHDERPLWSLENKDQSRITVFRSGDFEDYMGYPLFHSTGYVKIYEVRPFLNGILLRFPESHEVQQISPLTGQKKLMGVYAEHERWKKILNIRDIADVNDATANGKTSDLVSLAEGLHEKKIRQIVEYLIYNRKRYRTVHVVGPSSSGKAAFTRRLEIALRVNGLEPVVLHLEDYLLDSEDESADESNTEKSVFTKVVDKTHLNLNIRNLLKGHAVEMPHYDPNERKRVAGPPCRLKSHQPLLIEGSDDLFSRIAQGIPRRRKYYIYIHALTEVNVTRHLRIDTGDVSILRLLIYNYFFQNITAADTIEQWHSLHNKEKWRIFPLLEKSDAVFNSSLVYELGVLRMKGIPVLETVPTDHPSFPEAQRLLEVLSYFAPIPPHEVPSHSILREFIGDSRFDAVAHPEELSGL